MIADASTFSNNSETGLIRSTQRPNQQIERYNSWPSLTVSSPAVARFWLTTLDNRSEDRFVVKWKKLTHSSVTLTDLVLVKVDISLSAHILRLKRFCRPKQNDQNSTSPSNCQVTEYSEQHVHLWCASYRLNG